MSYLKRRLDQLESRVRVGEVPEIEVWGECMDKPGVYRIRKTGAELTRDGLDQRNAERRERYGPGHVLTIAVNYVDAPVPAWKATP